MFGLDEKIATFSDGSVILVVIGVAILLGLRHATDPDHLAAVSTLISSGRERTGRVTRANLWRRRALPGRRTDECRRRPTGA